MSPIAALKSHLDRAADAGETRRFWWRDDDARGPSPALEVLFEQARDAGAPLALAVIPESLDSGLLAECEAGGVTVFQHGVSHTNHQRTGKSAELGDARSPGTVLAHCIAARSKLAGSPAFRAVMVPPWNRIAPAVLDGLPAAGYFGVSLFGTSEGQGSPHRVDTHIDPIAWRAGRDLAAPEVLVAMMKNAFQQEGPIGLLTHHLVHTPAITAFVTAFAETVTEHPAALWADPATLFQAAAPT